MISDLRVTKCRLRIAREAVRATEPALNLTTYFEWRCPPGRFGSHPCRCRLNPNGFEAAVEGRHTTRAAEPAEAKAPANARRGCRDQKRHVAKSKAVSRSVCRALWPTDRLLRESRRFVDTRARPAPSYRQVKTRGFAIRLSLGRCLQGVPDGVLPSFTPPTAFCSFPAAFSA